MKQTLPIAAAIILLFSACNNQRTNQTQQPAPKEETPKALQEKDSYEIGFSKRGGENLVEELYEELLAKDKQLQELETMMEAFRSNKPDSMKAWQDFDSKNKSYYYAANAGLNNMKDSLLMEKIKNMIAAAEGNYNGRVSYLRQMEDNVLKKAQNIDDLHSALKIVKTLPIIGKYQKENLPSAKPVEAIIKSADRIITKEDSLLWK